MLGIGVVDHHRRAPQCVPVVTPIETRNRARNLCDSGRNGPRPPSELQQGAIGVARGELVDPQIVGRIFECDVYETVTGDRNARKVAGNPDIARRPIRSAVRRADNPPGRVRGAIAEYAVDLILIVDLVYAIRRNVLLVRNSVAGEVALRQRPACECSSPECERLAVVS